MAAITVDQLQVLVTANSKDLDEKLAKINSQVGEVGEQTSKTGGKMSAAFSAIGKATGVALIAVGAGLTAMAVSSVKSFAQYEQLVGGVETLFKNSSKQVLEYANSAYKTAGLSANQYMEQATSFSATLLQGLGGDTAKATEYANKAIIDMSDNANKMGTDIGLIQNAYQGFAKDNYTMLDNLKLGYGGTATEMARLVTDSGVMGDSFKVTAENVKDIPFDQLIEAIHITQKEMGITGTTAEEASKTISGAFMSTTAAWKNVLTTFGTGSNKQIQAAIDGLVESATNLVTNIAAILPNVLNGISQFITAMLELLPTLIQQLIPTFVNIIIMAADTVITTLPMLFDAGVQLIVALVQGIAKEAPTLIPKIFEGLKSMIKTIVDNLPLFITAAVQLVVALVEGIAKEAPTLIPQIIEGLMKMIEAIIQQLPLLIESGIKLLVALVQGLANAIPQLIKYIPEIISTLIFELTKPSVLLQLISAALQIILAIALGLVEAIPQLIAVIPQIIANLIAKFAETDWTQIGKDILKGIGNGISGMGKWLAQKAVDAVNGAKDAIKNFFGIKSPSTVMRDEVGKMIGKGMAIGIDDSSKDVMSSMKDLANVSMGNFDSSVSVNHGFSDFVGDGTSQPLIVNIGGERIIDTVISGINGRSFLGGSSVINV